MFPRAVLTSERLRPRPFEAADAADVHAVWQDERFVRTAPVDYPYTNADLETAVQWCTTVMEERRLGGKGVGFAVEPREGGRLVGHVGLFGANWTAKVAEIHYWTAPWGRGNGYAAEAAGFAFEGVLRSAAPTRDGDRTDAALYSMIREDLPGG